MAELLLQLPQVTFPVPIGSIIEPMVIVIVNHLISYSLVYSILFALPAVYKYKNGVCHVDEEKELRNKYPWVYSDYESDTDDSDFDQFEAMHNCDRILETLALRTGSDTWMNANDIYCSRFDWTYWSLTPMASISRDLLYLIREHPNVRREKRLNSAGKKVFYYQYKY